MGLRGLEGLEGLFRVLGLIRKEIVLLVMMGFIHPKASQKYLLPPISIKSYLI